jgi:hypothetical protein
MPYVVKWVLKDQERVFEQKKPQASQAMKFADNLLKLTPKKIWIEDERGQILMILRDAAG